MITKELQQLSDKLTGGHINDHEISKQVDYIEKNYSGGGSGGGIFTVGCEYTNGVYRLNKTWNEIHDAVAAGMLVYAVGEDYYSALKEIYYYVSDEIPFYVVVFGTQVAGGHDLANQSGDAYPEYS